MIYDDANAVKREDKIRCIVIQWCKDWTCSLQNLFCFEREGFDAVEFKKA